MPGSCRIFARPTSRLRARSKRRGRTGYTNRLCRSLILLYRRLRAFSSGPDPAWLPRVCIRRWARLWWAISIRSSSRWRARSVRCWGTPSRRRTTSTSRFPAPAVPAWKPRWPTLPSPAASSRCSRTASSPIALREMARRQGATVATLAKDWGQPFDPQEAREFIRREQPQMVAFRAGRDFDRDVQPGETDLRGGP